MRFAPAGLVVLFLLTTVLFQNCTNGGSLTLYNTSIKSNAATDPDVGNGNVAINVPSAAQTITVDFISHGIDFPAITLDVGATGTDQSSLILGTTALPSPVTAKAFADICPSNTTTTPDETEIANLAAAKGYFLYTPNAEIFLSLSMVSGIPGVLGVKNFSVNDLNFTVLTRRRFSTTDRFQRRVCWLLGP